MKEGINAKDFILRGPSTVAEVCQNYNLKLTEHVAVWEEGWSDTYAGTFHFPRKLWHSAISNRHFAPVNRRIDEPYVQQMHLFVRHQYTTDMQPFHTLRVFCNHIYGYSWRAEAQTNAEIASKFEHGFFETLDKILQRFRGWDTDDLFNTLRRTKFLTRN